MKKYFMMLLSMMFVATMSVGFVSCGDDDEEVVANSNTSNGTSNSVVSPFGGTIDASIEGVWYLKSEKWMYYEKGGDIYVKEGRTPDVDEHEDYYKGETINITKSGDQYALSYDYKYGSGENEEHEIIKYSQIGDYEFSAMNSDGNRIVIISAASNKMVIGYYEDYGRISTGQSKEYGELTFMR